MNESKGTAYRCGLVGRENDKRETRGIKETFGSNFFILGEVVNRSRVLNALARNRVRNRVDTTPVRQELQT